MSAGLVTVVVTCRDRGRVLEDSVDSVFAQTYPAVEIVVVDDGSTDPFTRRVLGGFDWPRTTVLRQETRHAAAARNLALRHARGAFVCCLEAGDSLDPSYLAKAVSALEAAPSADFVSAGWRASASAVEVTPEDCGLVSLLAGSPHPAGVTRAEVIRAAGGYDEALPDGGADYDLWLRRLEAGGSGVVLGAPLLRRRVEPRLAAALLRKHAALYERHAPEILARRETLLAALWAADRGASADPPAPDDGRRLEQAQRRIAELEAAVADARYQVMHVRGSLSWRLTEPVRALLRFFRRGRPSAAGSTRPAPSEPAR